MPTRVLGLTTHKILKLDQIRLDGNTQPRVEFDEATIEDYAENYASGVNMPPLSVTSDGASHWLTDGFHRRFGAKRAGLAEIQCVITEGTQQDAQWASYAANITHGLRRSSADKELAVKRSLKHPHGAKLSDNQLAQHVGVSDKTVAKYRAELEATLEIPKLEKTVGRDGRARRRKLFHRTLTDACQRAGSACHVSQNTGMPEWYTPDEYLNAARAVLSEIDVDPASSVIAQQRVKAKAFYTVNDDGLAQTWTGRVWMNPPYTAGLVDRFMDKLVAHYAAGDVTEAVVLVNNATETRWWQDAAEHAAALCFPRGRVRFLDEEGNPGAPLQGQCVLYFGDHVEAFKHTFGGFGCCPELRNESQ